jgi:chaperonin GroES
VGVFSGSQRQIPAATEDIEMKFEPLNDVIIYRMEKVDRTAGGLVLPEDGQRRIDKQAFVIAVGPGRLLPNGERIPIPLKEGDRISVWNNEGSLEVGGKKVFFCREEHISAKLIPEDGDELPNTLIVMPS